MVYACVLTVLVFNKSEINVFDAKPACGLIGLFPTQRMDKLGGGGHVQPGFLHIKTLASPLYIAKTPVWVLLSDGEVNESQFFMAYPSALLCGVFV